ncbi:MAG: GAF domain-containing protein [Candidatus Promineifilaceae bacterium]
MNANQNPALAPAAEREKKMLDLLQAISLSVAEAKTSEYAFRQVLSYICDFMDWPLGHVYIWSDTQKVLISSGIWFVAEEGRFDAFRALSEQTTFLPGVGTIGRVIAQGKDVTVLDVRQDTSFVRQLPVDEGGIRAYFAFPVVMGDQIMAVLEFFSPYSGAPDEEMTSVIYHAGALLGMAVERERTYQRLQRSRAQLDEAQRTAHVAHWEWDITRDAMTLSAEMYRIYGVDRTAFDATYEGFLRHVHPDDLAQVQEKIQDASQNGRYFDLFYRLVRPDGEIRIVHAHGRPIYSEAGQIIKLYGTIQDMTELKQAEMELRRRLNETDALGNITNAMVGVLELDQVLQLIVESMQEIISHADWTAIHLLQPNSERLELVASAGLQIGAGEYTILPGQGIAGQVITTGELVNIADVQSDPRRLPVDQNTQAHALLVALVESRHRRLGTISVQCATPNTFTSDDEHLLKMLGIQAGIAIDNARLYAEQRRARERAERQGKRIRRMARRVVQAQEEERTRISRELHDEAGQALTALKIGLELTRAQLPAELDETDANLQELVQLANDTLTNLRRISHNLRPPGLDAYGLDAALRGLCEDFSRHTSLAVIYEGQDVPVLQPLPALSLYRFAQEALTNVAKHAAASSVEVKLEAGSDTIKLYVEDDGRGFIPPDWEANVLPQGTGLVGMLERLEMVDGFLDIVSTEGAGTRLTAVVPLETEET